MEARERDHVHRQLPQIGVQLSWEAQTGGDAGHGGRDKVVEVPVGGRGQLEGAEADVVEGLVIDAERLVRVLHQLVDREGRVVRFHHSVGHLGGGDHAEGHHDPVGVLLSDLGDEQGAHAGPGSAP